MWTYLLQNWAYLFTLLVLGIFAGIGVVSTYQWASARDRRRAIASELRDLAQQQQTMRRAELNAVARYPQRVR